jgi:hypothetical protein
MFLKMKVNRIYITLGIIFTIVISAVNIYLAKSDVTVNSLAIALNNMGLALSENVGMPNTGCYQEVITSYERQGGTYLSETWYKKTVTYSCIPSNIIRYCEIGTRVYTCSSNCTSSNVDAVGWSLYSSSITGRYCN